MIIDVAKKIAKEAHDGQVDRAGVDYFSGHLCAVAAACVASEDIAVAYLHDIIEDVGYSSEYLIRLLVAGGVEAVVASRVVASVVAMTKFDGESYDDYLIRVRYDDIARRVKLADLSHNSDLSRLSVVTESDIARNEKYTRAIAFLS